MSPQVGAAARGRGRGRGRRQLRFNAAEANHMERQLQLRRDSLRVSWLLTQPSLDKWRVGDKIPVTWQAQCWCQCISWCNNDSNDNCLKRISHTLSNYDSTHSIYCADYDKAIILQHSFFSAPACWHVAWTDEDDHGGGRGVKPQLALRPHIHIWVSCWAGWRWRWQFSILFISPLVHMRQLPGDGEAGHERVL